MKMILCADVKLGAVSAENLDIQHARRWQAVRATMFEDLVDQAAQHNARYLLLAGQLFGQARVTESLIDKLFDLVRSNGEIRVLALVCLEEFQRLSYRKDVPENLHVICMDGEGERQMEALSIRVAGDAAELQWGGAEALRIARNDAGDCIAVLQGRAARIPTLEPTGFEEAEDAVCGYAVLTADADAPAAYHLQGRGTYAYSTIRIHILPGDDQKEIQRKITAATRDVQRDSFLRITLTGRSAFGLTISSDALRQQLENRIFFVDVYDNTEMDIDEDAFETDISLRSEFVRLALADETLSKSERNRIISCGWNALSGKEVAGE